MNSAHDTIDMLDKQYSGNEYVLKRMDNYIVNILPRLLENADKNNNERHKRKEELSCKSTEYINKFMLTNKYYYCCQNELFVLYDNKHFISCSEDDIQYKILSGISNDGELVPWKYKIKIAIIKLIKERSPLKAIPESATIQFVINLFFPGIFASRNHVKYFLTVLGDILTGKTTDIYIASACLKNIINELHIQNNTYFENININNNIKYKYHSYDFNKCRLLYINKQIKHIDIPNELSKHAVDILCVATHYSSRYKSSDKFLYQCNEKVTTNHVLFLQQNKGDAIVNSFIDKYIEPCQKSSISNKNMIFIWKKHLNEKNLPNILLHETLLSMLKQKINYNETEEIFTGVTSKILPVVAEFIQFWDETVIEYANEVIATAEYEIDEIALLFKKWTNKKFNDIEDSFILELIRHLYVNSDGNVHIDDDKYIVNIKCDLWDKSLEVTESLTLFKDEYGEEITQLTNYNMKSLSDAYTYYLIYKKDGLVISKHYFDKVAKDIMSEFLDSDGVIKNSWFINVS